MTATFDPPERRHVLVIRLRAGEDREALARAVESLVSTPDPVVLDASDLMLTDAGTVRLLAAAEGSGTPIVCNRLSGRRILRRGAPALELFASVEEAVAALGAPVPHAAAEGWQGTEPK